MMNRSFIAAGKYYLIPVKGGAPKISVRLLDARKECVGYFDLEPGTAADCDFPACGVTPVPVGETFTLECSGDRVPELSFTDAYPEAPDAYASPERPKYHFSSRRGWLNDPNGLFYLDGLYHLFYQHNPYGVGWGNMHWGHAVSRDLLHWEESADVLAPDAEGAMFSGSAVVDFENTSGLGDEKTPPVLLYYTAFGKDGVQCLAFSTDGGRSFRKYAGNPLIATTKDARDPDILWHKESQRWIMALYLGDYADHAFAFYRSTDLIHWEVTSRAPFAISPERECPGFLRLPVAGESGVEKHIFLGANGIYRIGDFDGEGFLEESGPHCLFVRSGENCLYAGQSWFNSADGRHLYIAWQTGDSGSKVFNQTMSIPVELELRRFPEGLRLTANPVRELETLYGWSREFPEIAIDNAAVPALWTGIPKDDAWDIEFEVADRSNLNLVICGNDFAFDAEKRIIRFCAAEFALPEEADFKVRILVDRNSYELFAADGRIWCGKRLRNLPDHPLLVPGQLCGKGVLRNVKLRQARSVWR